jgi:hypothetical protein
MRTVRWRIYATHLTVYRGIIEQLEQVEIDAFPTAFVTYIELGLIVLRLVGFLCLYKPDKTKRKTISR